MSCLKNNYLNKQDDFTAFFSDYTISKNDEIISLKKFLDGIELNKNYFRTGLKKNHKSHSTKESDTYTIKSLNNNLNKISGMNKDKIISEILKECNTKKHLYSYFFDTILNKTITHSNYIECYSLIIKGLVDSSTKSVLLNSIELIKNDININHKIKEQDTDNDTYDELCDINLYTEKLYGLNLLLIKLEKLGILENYIQGNLQDFFCIMEHTEDENVIYRVLSCLFQMNNEIDNLLSQEHITKLKILKDSTKPKNKFKIIDILEKYN